MEDALEKLQYELYYIKNMSLALDLVIMFHTVKTMISGAEHGQAPAESPVASVQGVVVMSAERHSSGVQRAFADADEPVHQPGASSELQAVLRGIGGVPDRSCRARAISRSVDSVGDGAYGPGFQRARHRAVERRAYRSTKSASGTSSPKPGQPVWICGSMNVGYRKGIEAPSCRTHGRRTCRRRRRV